MAGWGWLVPQVACSTAWVRLCLRHTVAVVGAGGPKMSC